MPLYYQYVDRIVAPILKHGDSAVDGIKAYGDDYLMLYNSYVDEFAENYAKHGDEAVEAYLKYGDEAWKVLDGDSVTNPGVATEVPNSGAGATPNISNGSVAKLESYVKDIVDENGVVNAKKMNVLKNDIQKGPFTKRGNRTA